LIDFARFQQIEMADHVAALAAACVRRPPAKACLFYGYFFEFGRSRMARPPAGTMSRPVAGAGYRHIVLASPTRPGMAPHGVCMSAAESVREGYSLAQQTIPDLLIAPPSMCRRRLVT
jgi:hypothetical protein